MSKRRYRKHSASNYLFSEVPVVKVPRSTFPSPSTWSGTIEPDYMIPIFCRLFYPGDTIKIPYRALVRLNSAPVVPVMDDLYLDTLWFAVPPRLVWDNWSNFLGEHQDTSDILEPNDYTIPQLVAPETGFGFETLMDYSGVNPLTPGASVSSLPYRCMLKAYNDWVRDENLIDPLDYPTGDTGDSVEMYQLFKRAKVHDYFTSCLPWPQKGPSVVLPIGDFAPVIGDGNTLGLTNGSSDFTISQFAGNYDYMRLSDSPVPGSPVSSSGPVGGTNATGAFGVSTDPSHSGIHADLSGASGITVNIFRDFFATQRLLEKDARSGTRLPEIIEGHFGVKSSDARLQYAELLYTRSDRFTVNPVAQTSATMSGQTPQGNLAAYMVGSTSGQGPIKSFTEHTYVIGFACIRTSNKYQYGIPREFSYKTRLDFYWPVFSHLGEQAVLNKEIYAQGPDVKDDQGRVVDDLPFGYQERWAEMRYSPSLITGKLRSNYADAPDSTGSLDVWHLAPKWDQLPELNQSFIESNVPIKRLTSVTSEPSFIADFYFGAEFTRPLPLYSTPGLVDHY